MPDTISPIGQIEKIQNSNAIPVQGLEFTGQEQLPDPQTPQQISQYTESQPQNIPEISPVRYVSESNPNIEQYGPQQQHIETQPQIQHSVEERQLIPESETPALQYELNPNPLRPQDREGEHVFINPNLDPSLGHTQPATTTTQPIDPKAVTARIGGYPVSSMYGSSPMMAIIQQTVAAGDPQSANTWQATVVDKVVRSLLNILGINR